MYANAHDELSLWVEDSEVDFMIDALEDVSSTFIKIKGISQTLASRLGLKTLHQPMIIDGVSNASTTTSQVSTFNISPRTNEERKPHVTTHVTTEADTFNSNFLAKYSDLSKLLHVTCYILRFCHNYQKPVALRLTGVPTVCEWRSANLKWIRIQQKIHSQKNSTENSQPKEFKITLQPRSETIISIPTPYLQEEEIYLIPAQTLDESILCSNTVNQVRQKQILIAAVNPTEQSVQLTDEQIKGLKLENFTEVKVQTIQKYNKKTDQEAEYSARIKATEEIERFELEKKERLQKLDLEKREREQRLDIEQKEREEKLKLEAQKVEIAGQQQKLLQFMLEQLIKKSLYGLRISSDMGYAGSP
ncbi:hypothetical protein ACI65C_006455 [Semiaphis heraclei]